MKNFIYKLYNSIAEFLFSIPNDKLLHCIAGLIIAAFFSMVLHSSFCIFAVIFCAIVKEFIDMARGTGFDWQDLVATIGGGLLIQLFSLFL